MKKFNMKKTTAAAVAAAVGAALLLGGAGTLAYWNDTADSAPQTIATGTLDLSDITEGSWVHVTATGADGAPVGQIVPGDVVRTTVAVPVKLAGENLKAKLKVSQTNTESLSEAVTVSTQVGTGQAVSTGVAESQELSSITSKPAQTVNVTVTVTFDKGSKTNELKDNVDMSFNDGNDVAKAMKFKLTYLLQQV